MNYCIARFPEGISLNGLEFLLDENNETLEFPSKEEAINYLAEATGEEWEEQGVFFKEVSTCLNCGYENVEPSIKEDALGQHVECLQCKTTYDI